MKSSVLLPLVIASAAAQLSTSCNPLQKTCPADPALGKSAQFDFTQGQSDQFGVVHSSNRIGYSSDGATFTIQGEGDNPTIASKFYIMFGRVEVVLQAAPGTGIVSSFVLQSDDLDEIDLEFLGGDSTQMQSNYFSQGKADSYNRGQFHSVDGPQKEYHKYTIDWTDQQIDFFIDDNNVRTIPSNSPAGYPQTPMQIRIGAWAGGDSSNSQGTIQWAGGATNYGDGPFTYYVKSLDVTDYSTGQKYQYTDNSGSWQSIEAIGGKVNGNSNDQGQGSSSTASPSPTSTSGTSTEPTTISSSSSSSSSPSPNTETSQVASTSIETSSSKGGAVVVPKSPTAPDTNTASYVQTVPVMTVLTQEGSQWVGQPVTATGEYASSETGQAGASGHSSAQGGAGGVPGVGGPGTQTVVTATASRSESYTMLIPSGGIGGNGFITSGGGQSTLTGAGAVPPPHHVLSNGSSASNQTNSSPTTTKMQPLAVFMVAFGSLIAVLQ